MGFSGQESWSKQASRSPGDLPDPGIEPGLPQQADSSSSEPPGMPNPLHIIFQLHPISFRVNANSSVGNSDPS